MLVPDEGQSANSDQASVVNERGGIERTRTGEASVLDNLGTQGVTTSIVYCFPRTNHEKYNRAARLFVSSYLKHPPGVTPHEIIVAINGQPGPNRNDERLFSPLPVRFTSHTNVGKDIGAYQMVAREYPADLQLYFGAHTHFRKSGWLDVIVNSFLRHGPGLYGAWGFHEPAMHIRTTAFWMPSELLNAYPHEIHNGTRYEFEHGRSHSILKFVKDLGLEAWMVTWKATYPSAQFTHVTNEDSLILDQHTQSIGYT